MGLKCLRCSKRQDLGLVFWSVISFLWSFLLTIFLWFGIGVGAGLAIGIGVGMGVGAIFGLKWNPLPWTAWVLMGVGGIVGGLLSFLIHAKSVAKNRIIYGNFYFRVIVFEYFVKGNKNLFCCTQCYNEYVSNFNEKKQKKSKKYRDKVEKERLQRIEDKKNEGVGVVIPGAGVDPVIVHPPPQHNNEMEPPQPLFNPNNTVPNKMYQPSVPEFNIPQQQFQTKVVDSQPTVPEFAYQPSTGPVYDEYVSNESGNNSSTCCICLDRKSNVLYYPCKHLSQCDLCPEPVLGIGRCPICRVVVTKCEKVYIT